MANAAYKAPRIVTVDKHRSVYHDRKSQALEALNSLIIHSYTPCELVRNFTPP